MSEIDELIDKLLGLRAFGPATVGAVVGSELSLKHENPYHLFYEGHGSGRVTTVMLRIGKCRPGSAVNLYFNVDEPYLKSEIELSRYGAIVDIQMFPELQPEGGVAFSYEFRDHGIMLSFASVSGRLQCVTVSKK